MGDSDRLQQVFWNLLSNAVKFTPSGGRIHVALKQVDSHVRISFEDTGVGIAAKFLPHVFDRFRQEDGDVEPSLRWNGAGSGYRAESCRATRRLDTGAQRRIGSGVHFHSGPAGTP